MICLLSLGSIFRKFGIQSHCYANDTELYLPAKPTSSIPPPILSDCVSEIKEWLTLNVLKLNSSKTEILHVFLKLAQSKFSIMIFDDISVPVSIKVKTLGVIFDSTLSIEAHINNVVRSAYFHL